MTGTDETIGSQPADEADKVDEVETLKKNYSDSTREATFRAEQVKVLKDNTYLAKVSGVDKKLAEKIAQDTWWISLDNALNQLEGVTEKKDEPADKGGSPSKEDLDKWYEEKQTSEKVKEKFESVKKDLELEDGSDDLKNFMEEYELLSSGKKMTPELVSKFAKLAYTEIKGGDVEAVARAKKIVSAQTISATPAGESSKKEKPSLVTIDKGAQGWYD